MALRNVEDAAAQHAHLEVRGDAETGGVEAQTSDEGDGGVTEHREADVVVVAFGTPGAYVRSAVRSLRSDGVRVGWIRPVTLVPFPSEVIAAAARNAKVVAVYENNAGQMLDDVRLSVLGDAPVAFIGGLSLDASGFGIAPDLQVSVLRRRILDVAERHR